MELSCLSINIVWFWLWYWWQVVDCHSRQSHSCFYHYIFQDSQKSCIMNVVSVSALSVFDLFIINVHLLSSIIIISLLWIFISAVCLENNQIFIILGIFVLFCKTSKLLFLLANFDNSWNKKQCYFKCFICNSL